MKIEQIDGKIVETLQPDEVYIGLYSRLLDNKDEVWTCVGYLFRNLDPLAENLSGFAPDRILAVKVQIPKEEK